MPKAPVTLDFEKAKSLGCCNGRDMTSCTAASFKKVKFNTWQIIIHLTCINVQSSTLSRSAAVLNACSFNSATVMYRSTVGHTVSRDVNSQGRVHQAWTLNRSEMHFRSDAFACVWMEVNGMKSLVSLRRNSARPHSQLNSLCAKFAKRF